MSCGQSEADCSCAPHQWDRETVRGAVLAILQGMPGFADLDGPNAPIGFAPCHQKTHIADVTGYFWTNGVVGIGGAGPQQARVTYHIYVTFKPCIPIPNDEKKKKKKEDKYQGPTSGKSEGGNGPAENTIGFGGNPGSRGGLTISVEDPLHPISTTQNPATNVNTAIDVGVVTQALGGVPTSSDGTQFLFADLLHVDLGTLLGIRSWGQGVALAASNAWLARPVISLEGPDSWTMEVPTTAWASYQQAGTATLGGSSSTPTSPPPPPPPSSKTGR
jgi:hypothetical protein